MFLAGGLTDYVSGLFGRFHYLAPFTVLFLCGLGLPLPEEVALIGSGILLYQDKVEFYRITLVCSAAILLGDSVPYWLGRHWGLAALKSRLVAKVMHAERFAVLERRFEQHGNWVVFSCRFMPGLRIPAYFVAGTLGMGFARFLLLDLLGVLISVPASIWLGHLFGGSMDLLHKRVKGLHLVLGFAVFAVVAILVWRRWKRRRESEPSPLPEPPGALDRGDPQAPRSSAPIGPESD